MNKEPIGLYIFRFVLGFGLFAFMCMLYWSSLLLEENMRSLRSDVIQIKSEINALRRTGDKMLNEQIHWQREIPKSSAENTSLSETQIDPSLPNLLSEDPFYAHTLPKLLGSAFKPTGTLRTATIGKPDNLHPFSNWAQVGAWRSLCVTAAARLQFGKFETMAPDLAIKIEERKQKQGEGIEYWVHLRNDLFWTPLSEELFTEKIALAEQFMRQHPLTAEDFKFWYDAMSNPYNQETGAVALRTLYADIEDVQVVDKLTFVVRWKPIPVKQPDGTITHKTNYFAKQLTGGFQPLPCFVFKYFADGTKIVEDDSNPNTYQTNSVWANNFNQHWAKNVIVGCGPWNFEGMTDRQVTFKRNPNYYPPLAALTEGYESKIKNTTDTIWQDFKVDNIDVYNVNPDQLIELENFKKSSLYKSQVQAGSAIHRIDYYAPTYTYLGWNMTKPYFESKKVRRALTMAIDRQRIIEQNLNGMGMQTSGPFFFYSPSYDRSISPWPFDPEAARRLLETEGWYDSDGDGVIDKLINGKRVPFRFNLTYFVKNPTTKSVCEYIATALKEVGIDCVLNGVDIADLSAVFDDKSFDAVFLAWSSATPPENPKQLWYSTGAKEKGSSNAVGFNNPEADTIIDQLQWESDPKQRLNLYHRFHQIIHEEQPYTFLFSQKIAMLYRERVQNVFIPAERQDLIPGANIAEPDSSIYWIKKES